MTANVTVLTNFSRGLAPRKSVVCFLFSGIYISCGILMHHGLRSFYFGKLAIEAMVYSRLIRPRCKEQWLAR